MTETFHRIWFGNNPIPASYEAYWAAWQRQYPDCDFVTWTDADLDRLELTRPVLDRLSSHVSRSDVARYEILYRFGGIYLDCDILPYTHFDVAEMASQLTVCNETEATDYCSIGFIATPPGHPVFRDIIAHVNQAEIDETRPNVTTGPYLFGAALHAHPHRRLPVDAFYPYLYDEPYSAVRKKDLSRTLGIHVWGGSWLAPEQKKDKALALLRKGDIAEPAAIVAGFADDWAEDIRCVIETIADVRTKSAQLAPFLSDDLSIDGAAKTVFQFDKVVHWLLETDPHRLVWQIGAADGILVDPLRSALVNFDPPALLLEPNPYMFAKLGQGYANNRKARLLQLAYGTGETELVLNAINPAKAAELGLPHWVLGISSVYDDKNAIGGLTIDAETTRLIQSCIERVAVAVTHFDALVAQGGGRQPDVLVIDAEGMDEVILNDILTRGCRPEVIHFEIQCMDPSDYRILAAQLSADYLLLPFGNDITAYRNDVVMAYAKSLYVQNGIPTVFRSALATLNGL
jgi:FkbM family methyltransferase